MDGDWFITIFISNSLHPDFSEFDPVAECELFFSQVKPPVLSDLF